MPSGNSRDRPVLRPRALIIDSETRFKDRMCRPLGHGRSAPCILVVSRNISTEEEYIYALSPISPISDPLLRGPARSVLSACRGQDHLCQPPGFERLLREDSSARGGPLRGPAAFAPRRWRGAVHH